MSASDELPQYKIQLNQIAAEIQQGCGLVYELYAQRFTSEALAFVDSLDGERKSDALAHAVFLGAVVPSDADGDEFKPQEGYCSHFLRFDECPLGCGDLD